MTDLETALREQIRLAVNAQVALDVVTDHCHSILEQFRSNLDEDVSPEVKAIIEANDPGPVMPGAQMTPGQAMYAAHMVEMIAPDWIPVESDGGMVAWRPLPSLEPTPHGVQYEGDTAMNTGHTAVIHYE